MKATDIISFIKVSEKVIENHKEILFIMIRDAVTQCYEMFAMSPEDLRAVRQYCRHYEDMPLFLYEKLNELAEEDGKAFVTIWIANGEKYIVEPREIPKGFFKSIITVLNYD